jgi:hypothetical protein
MLARSTIRNLIECRDELNVLPCQRRGRERVGTGIWNFLSAHRFRAVSRCSDTAEPLSLLRGGLDLDPTTKAPANG